MMSSRNVFVALGASALLSVASLALACEGSEGACACNKGAEAAAVDGKAAEKMPCAEGGCACQKKAAAEAAAASAAAKVEAPATDAQAATAKAGAQQQAVLDPATGRLTVPADGGAAIQAQASAGIPMADRPAPAQVAQPNGGVMAAFPADRAAKVVATVDENGKPHAGCAE